MPFSGGSTQHFLFKGTSTQVVVVPEVVPKMPVPRKSYKMNLGETFTLDFFITDDAGVAQDLTNWNIGFNVRTLNPGDSTDVGPLLTKTIANGGVVAAAQNGAGIGHCNVTLNPPDLASLPTDSPSLLGYTWLVKGPTMPTAQRLEVGSILVLLPV